MEFSAVVVGCTGAVGREVVRLLVNNKACQKVIGFSRRSIEPENWTNVFNIDPVDDATKSKLLIRATDYEALSEKNFQLENGKFPSKVFYCLGTTRRDAGSAEQFRKVDLDYVSECAKLSKLGGVEFFGLVSAVNANKDSYFLYPQVKGLAEEVVKAEKFPHTAIFQPGLLNRGDKARTMEKILSWIVPTDDASAVASSMIECSEKDVPLNTVTMVTKFRL